MYCLKTRPAFFNIHNIISIDLRDMCNKAITATYFNFPLPGLTYFDFFFLSLVSQNVAEPKVHSVQISHPTHVTIIFRRKLQIT